MSFSERLFTFFSHF